VTLLVAARGAARGTAGSPGLARRYLDEAERSGADPAELRQTLARVALAAGESSAALAALDQARELASEPGGRPDAIAVRAVALARLDRRGEAEAALAALEPLLGEPREGGLAPDELCALQLDRAEVAARLGRRASAVDALAAARGALAAIDGDGEANRARLDAIERLLAQAP
jgi:hypothetical protein